MNGFELTSEIKNHAKLKQIPVIIVSYKDREEDRIQGLEAGADYYLTKSSFHDDTLLRAVAVRKCAVDTPDLILMDVLMPTMDGDDLQKILSSVQIETERIREIVLSIRNFSRLDQAEKKAVNIHEGIESTLLLLNHYIKQEIQIIKQYGDLPLFECFLAQLNQVFMNILSNAIDALLEKQEHQTQKQILIKTDVTDIKTIRVNIIDNGSGIPPEIHNKIFDPLFTTKPVNKGTGLGLAISYQIIERHKGTI